ncbi:MAG: hypothetical protein ACRD3W_06090, partial [Terriglobales bacterium]
VAIHAALKRNHDYTGSYSSVYRMVVAVAGSAVNVHPAVSFEVDRLVPISFRDSARMNNPYSAHTGPARVAGFCH